MSGQILPDWLQRRADDRRDRVALIVGDRAWTFAELDRAVEATSAALRRHGIAPGDRVALLARNGFDFVRVVHAVPRIGATLVPLNLRLTAAELSWQLRDVGAKLLIHDDSQQDLARRAAEDLPLVVAADLRAEPATRESLSVDLAATHSIIYTSGTTGQPKGALLTFGNFWWSAVGSALNLGHSEDDRWLAVLPLFHVGGLSILLRSAIYGITAVVQPGFDPAAVNRAIDSQGISIVSVVSVMLQRMLEERGDRPYPLSLRCVLLGGGPAPQPLLEECARRGVPVVQTYGLTESASQVATLAPSDALRKLGSAGKPLLPTELRIEADGRGTKANEPGEIVVRGPTISPGYVNVPPWAESDGWLHTGDLGYLDDEGYLFVLDRRNDLIVSGGENVYPAEVEAALLAHPAVEDAGVVGLPDPRWGRVPGAIVKLRAGVFADEAGLVQHCATRLAAYKVPKSIRFANELPRNAAGKLRRDLLRREYAPD